MIAASNLLFLKAECGRLVRSGVRMTKERRKRDREPATQKIIESVKRKPVQRWNQEMLDRIQSKFRLEIHPL
jgi:hypothetical protein